MSGEPSVSFELLARGQQQLISEVRSMKDDMGVMVPGIVDEPCYGESAP